jgi:TolA-binding protein
LNLEALGRHVAERQDALSVPEGEHERLRTALVERFATKVVEKPHRIGARAAVALAAMVLGAVLGVVWLVRTEPEDLRFYVGRVAAPADVGRFLVAAPEEPLPVQFSDGTRVALWPGARGRVTAVSPRGADIVVEKGRASFEVVPGHNRRWRVSTGPFLVEVTGTRFDVDWHPEEDAFSLELYEGHVRVSGCSFGDGQAVQAGERVEASCGRREFRVSAIPARGATDSAASAGRAARADSAAAIAIEPRIRAEEAPSDDAARNRPTKAVPQRTGSGAAPDGWLPFAKEGRYREAYAAADRVGFDRECATRSAAEVLLLGDAARLSGHLDRATQAYLSARSRFPGTSSAAIAAFMLGRAEFDQRGDVSSAEHWLETYLAEQPSGPFAAAALGRTLEAEVRQGRMDAARAVAARYLERYPSGAHAEAARKVLETPSAKTVP